jgi:hypothetical protein
MSTGGYAAKEHADTETEASAVLEVPSQPCINLLLEQLTYCLAIAKRLADSALAEASKK